MRSKKIHTGVFITCFTRSCYLDNLISILREVKPPFIFIASDGPRKGNEEDMVKITKCRKEFEKIDWDCKVFKFYSDENLGILKNNYYNLKKVFEVVDRVILLEDDMKPSLSFFYFCDELLEKYKDDYRIQRICGGNFIGNYKEVSSDYFFARCVYSGAGAIWKRSFYQNDWQYFFLEDDYSRRCFNSLCDHNFISKFKKDVLNQKESYSDKQEVLSFEKYYRTNFFLQSQTNLFPKKNLVRNQGISKESTHNGDNINLFPKKIRKQFLIEIYNLDFPLKHPNYIMNDLSFEKYVQKDINLFSIKSKLLYIIERTLREVRYKGIKSVIVKMKNTLRKSNIIDKNG